MDERSELPVLQDLPVACDLQYRDVCKRLYEGLKRGVKYDGCSGVPDWDFGKYCCNEHDSYYQLGDSTRAEADARMRECILNYGGGKKGYFLLAWGYWLGVRIFAKGVWDKYREEETITNADRFRN